MRTPSWTSPRVYLVPISSREGVRDEEEHLMLHFFSQIRHSANFKKKKKILKDTSKLLSHAKESRAVFSINLQDI